MCCDDDKMPKGQTQMQGGVGQPTGFEVDPADFMHPGGGLGENDVLGAIFARMQMNEGPPMEEEMLEGGYPA